MIRKLSLFILAALLLSGLGFAQSTVQVDQSKTGILPSTGGTLTSYILTTPRFATSTFAGLPAAASNTFTFQLATDWGANGTIAQSIGSRWKPMGGSSVLKLNAAPSSAIGTTTAVVLQTLLPAGSWQVGDVLRVTLPMTKSGTTDVLIGNVLIGTLGTVSDTSVTGGTVTMVGSANQTSGEELEFVLASATTVQRMGAILTNQGSYTTISATAPPAAVTISNVSNPLYVSFTINSNGTTNTVALQAGARITLYTP
jgi:hypothetical protein